MAAVLGRTEIEIKRTGSSCTVPNAPIAKLMYYFNCVCSCVEPEDDYTIRRLRDYNNYSSLSTEEEAKLMLLCLALSPDKLIGSVLFPNEDIDNSSNAFYEVTALKTRLVVAESLLIGGHQKKVQKIMMFKMVWIETYYLNPLKSLTERRNQRALPPPPSTQYRQRPLRAAPSPPSTQYRQQRAVPSPSPRQSSAPPRRRGNDSSCTIL